MHTEFLKNCSALTFQLLPTGEPLIVMQTSKFVGSIATFGLTFCSLNLVGGDLHFHVLC